MRGLQVSVTLLLIPAHLALAGVNRAHHARLHKRQLQSSLVASGSGASVVPTYTATGPYALGNETSGLAGSGTGTGTGYVTLHSTATQLHTIYDTNPTASEAGSEAGPTGGSGGGSGTGSSGESGDQCPSVVTVTIPSTVTVTVTEGGGSPAEAPSDISQTYKAAKAGPPPALGGGVGPPAEGPSTPSQSVEAGPPPLLQTSSVPESVESELANAETPANIPENIGPSPTSSPLAANVASVKVYGPASSVIPTPAQEASSSAAEEVLPTAASTDVSPAETPSSVASATQEESPATSSSTTTSSGSGGSKRGIILPAGGPDTEALTKAYNNAEKIVWCGNWYSSEPPDLNPRIEFVPQDYGRQSNLDGTWTKNADKYLAKGAKHFLSFGEPGTPNDKLFMTAPQAADLWMKDMQPYALKGVSVGAPGNLQNKQDFQYLTDFLAACDKLGCDIGFIAVHWFWTADPTHVDGFKDVINNATRIANGKPVWLDNLRADGSDAAQKEFFGEVIPWLDQNEGVARYAVLSTERSSGTGFLNADGSISDLGQWYANV